MSTHRSHLVIDIEAHEFPRPFIDAASSIESFPTLGFSIRKYVGNWSRQRRLLCHHQYCCNHIWTVFYTLMYKLNYILQIKIVENQEIDEDSFENFMEVCTAHLLVCIFCWSQLFWTANYWINHKLHKNAKYHNTSNKIYPNINTFSGEVNWSL